MGCDRWAVRMEWNAAIMFRLLDLAVNWLSQFRNMYVSPLFSSSTRGREKDMCSYIIKASWEALFELRITFRIIKIHT